MRHLRAAAGPRLAALAALGAVFLAAGSPTRAGGMQSTTPPAASTSSGGEHDDDRSPAIRMKWLLPVNPAHVSGRFVRLELQGVGLTMPYDVEIRTLEDAGSLQTRRLGQPLRGTLVAPFRLDVPVAFGATAPLQMTHSGMFVAVLKACTTAGACLTGTSEPLFFHPDGGGHVVYDETGLCALFHCGALQGGETAERGTWRVMGGGPRHAAPSREEPGTDGSNPIVDGGQR